MLFFRCYSSEYHLVNTKIFILCKFKKYSAIAQIVKIFTKTFGSLK
jgi:hypothetical protein